MSKWDIQWSPSEEDTFIAFTSDKLDFDLYQLQTKKQDETKGVTTSSKTSCNIYSVKEPKLIASKGTLFLKNKDDIQHLKCFSYCPVSTVENVVALGLTNGKVVLTGFNTDPGQDRSGLVGNEISSKSPRPCTALAWNPIEHQYLAIAHDKYRSSSAACLSVCTISSQEGSEAPADRSFSSHRSAVVEYPVSQGDTVNSMAWLHQPPNCLACGLGGKHIKLFDIRAPSDTKSSAMTSTKAVFGITPNLHLDNQLASFFEDQIYIWDLRHFDKPVLSFKETQHIVKMQWSPTRRNMLVSLTKDSPAIKLYNIEHVLNEVEYTERIIQPFSTGAVSSFTLHPTHENSMLAVSSSDKMQNVVIHDIVSLTMSPYSSCSIASGRNLLHWSMMAVHEEDISTVMRQRAVKGYGQKEPLYKNTELLGDGPSSLKNLWVWLYKMKAWHNDGKIPLRKPKYRFYGIKAVIKGEVLEDTKSVIENVKWEGMSSWMESTIYKSKERTLALKLCGWPMDSEDFAFREFLQRVERSDNYERAAAIAVFRSKGRMAIDILNRGSETSRGRSANFNAIAMALAGMTTGKKSLWSEMCSSLCKQLDNPYLRAMFGFLTTTDNFEYNSVLKECELFLEDRVAFACIYLNDANLTSYIEEVTHNVISSGDLNGVLLTGLNRDGVELLQSYLDKTSDIQSVSCVMSHASPLDHTEMQGKRVRNWMNSYKGLLDRWRLWHQRAKFDVLYYQSWNTSAQVPLQIFVNCHYCSKPISPSVIALNSLHPRIHRNPVRGGSAPSFKFKACYMCRKSLPRCSLCQLNMGTSSFTCKLLPQRLRANWSEQNSAGGDNPAASKQTDFGDWFTWCQSCRHGGHASHLMEWFKEHSECPVAACNCMCMSLDSVGVVPAEDTIDS